MEHEFVGRSFKSGNSIAIRLPKELGVQPGREFNLVQHADKSITAVPAERSRKNFAGLAGRMSPGWMAEGRLNSDSPVRTGSDAIDPPA